jgi:hypothetical protein
VRGATDLAERPNRAAPSQNLSPLSREDGFSIQSRGMRRSLGDIRNWLTAPSKSPKLRPLRPYRQDESRDTARHCTSWGRSLTVVHSSQTSPNTIATVTPAEDSSFAEKRKPAESKTGEKPAPQQVALCPFSQRLAPQCSRKNPALTASVLRKVSSP